MSLLDSYNELKAALQRIKDDEDGSVRLYLVDENYVTRGGYYLVLDISKYIPSLRDQVEKDLKEILSDTRHNIKHLMDDEERREKEEEQNGTEVDIWEED